MATGIPELFSFNKTSGKMDYFGQVVNRAARVGGQAAPGEICLIAATQAKLPNVGEYYCQTRGAFNLKGVVGEQEIFTILPKELEGRVAGFDEARAEAAQTAMSPGAFSPAMS